LFCIDIFSKKKSKNNFRTKFLPRFEPDENSKATAQALAAQLPPHMLAGQAMQAMAQQKRNDPNEISKEMEIPSSVMGHVRENFNFD
jgi:hypothetical protein